LATEEGGESPTARKRAVAAVVKDVSAHLGNTPAVARSAYIDPRIVELFEEDETVEDVLADVDVDGVEDLEHGIPEEVELAVLDLIDRARRSKRRSRRTSAKARAA
jgi:DNA topoisomerase IB